MTTSTTPAITTDRIVPAEHIGLAHHIAARVRGVNDPAVDREDLAQEAMVKICAADRTFDPARNVRPSTYLHKITLRHLTDPYRNKSRNRRAAMCNLAEDAEADIPQPTRHADPHRDRDLAETVHTLIESLPEPYDETVRAIVRHHGHLKHAADELGLTRGAMDQRKNRIRQLLTAALKRRGLTPTELLA